MANVSENVDIQSDLIDSKAKVALVGILYLEAAAIVLLNIPSVLIVIYSLLRNKKVKNIHVLSLSVTDEVFGLFWFLVIDTNLTDDGSISYSECVIRFYITSAAYVASCTHILGICIERVCLICFNIKAFKENRKTVSVITIIASWMFAFTSMVVVYLRTSDGGEKTCSLTRIFSSSFPIAAVFLLGINIGILISTFILMGFLIKYMRKVNALNARTISKNDIRMCLTTVVIVTLGTICNTPWMAILFYSQLVQWPSRRVRSILFMLSGCNSALNPIVYIFRIKEYRTLVKEAICGKNRISPTRQTVIELQ